MKNIDKIRQMTVDELAKFIEEECKACYIQAGIYADVNNIRNWLEQEVGE